MIEDVRLSSALVFLRFYHHGLAILNLQPCGTSFVTLPLANAYG